MDWFYFNKNGEKVGPISVNALKLLVQQGIIGRETVIENSNGRTSLAGNVRGLEFPSLLDTKKLTIAPSGSGEVYGLAPPPPPITVKSAQSKSASPFTKEKPTPVPKPKANASTPTASDTPFSKQTAKAESPFVETASSKGNPFAADKKPATANPFTKAPIASNNPFDTSKPTVDQTASQSVPTTSQTASKSGNRRVVALLAGSLLLLIVGGIGWWFMYANPAVSFTAAERAEIKAFVKNYGNMIYEVDEDGTTALHAAAANGNLTIVKYLVSKGLSVHAKTMDGSTPLDYAKLNALLDGNTAVVEYLSDVSGIPSPAKQTTGVSTAKQAENSETINSVQFTTAEQAQFTAAERAEIERFCREYGSDVKAVDEDGYTLLHRAAERGKVEIVKFLVFNGADVNAKNSFGNETPLHLAAQYNENVEVAKLLVSSGADIDAKTSFGGLTPLRLAVEFNENIEVVKFFISNPDNHRWSDT